MLHLITKYVDRCVILLGVASLGILVFVAFLQVVMRYVFSHALPWAEELCRFMFIALAYVGIALTMRGDRHLCVDLLLTYSPRGVQKILRLFSLGCTAAFMLLLGYLSYQMIWEVKAMNYMASSMPVPIYITWIPIPLCIWLSAFYAILNMIAVLKNEKTGD